MQIFVNRIVNTRVIAYFVHDTYPVKFIIIP